MSPEERRERIREILQEQQKVKVNDLAALFQVNVMTIYRDVDLLERQGEVIRTHGGIMLNTGRHSKPATPAPQSSRMECAVCHKLTQPGFRWHIVGSGGSVVAVCCGHCAVLYSRMQAASAPLVLAQEALRPNTLEAEHGFFVSGTDFTTCCAPAVYAFSQEEHAHRFALGFGGRVMTWAELSR